MADNLNTTTPTRRTVLSASVVAALSSVAPAVASQTAADEQDAAECLALFRAYQAKSDFAGDTQEVEETAAAAARDEYSKADIPTWRPWDDGALEPNAVFGGGRLRAMGLHDAGEA